MAADAKTNLIVLPEPAVKSEVSVEEALHDRRSVRTFTKAAVTLEQISQILWAAQGMTGEEDERTAPSAGALFPLEVLVAAGNVDGLSPGVYRYQPRKHALVPVCDGDRRRDLAQAALNQSWVRDGAAVVAVTAVYSRTARKYGDRGEHYTHMEAGSVVQNVYLQCQSLGLGTVMVGAFDDEAVREILGAAPNEDPLALMPVGREK